MADYHDNRTAGWFPFQDAPSFNVISLHSMHVVVNGFTRSVTQETSLIDLLAEEGIPPKQAIVEVNRTFVPPDALNSFVIRDGDVVEIILPAFGG